MNWPAGHLTFEYDIAGRLKKTTGHTLDGSTVLTEMEYDLLGHQTLLKDVDAGETHYVHNAFGELTSQTDANDQNHTMQYDAMGRITQRTGPDGTTTYQYVTSGNGLNQLRKVTAPNGTMQEYTYDELDRLASLKETVGDKIFTTAYTYDNFGRVKDITYPTGFTITHGYDQQGNLTTVSQGGTAIYATLEANTLGQVTRFGLGNGKVTTKGYSEIGLPTGTHTEDVLDMSYSFEPATGNMLSRSNNRYGLLEVFEHDDLDRLEEARVNGTLTLTVLYDDNGNITEKSDVGEYAYDSSSPHAVTSITNHSYAISQETQDITYTPMGRRTATITEGLHRALFTYGPDNERKKMEMQTLDAQGVYQTVSTRYYHGSYEELHLADGDIYRLHYIGGGDGLAAIYVTLNGGTGEFYYTYTDHLGSLLALTDDEGDLIAEQSFDAWGRHRMPATWSAISNMPVPGWAIGLPVWLSRGYTGHEHLPQFELINMNGRMYDPKAGRMLAPDNFVQAPGFTQSHNRYAYAWNNPLKYVDPDGEIVWAPILIAAAVGGVVNLASNAIQGNVGSVGQGFGYFFTGAASGVATVFGGPLAGGAVMGFGNDLNSQLSSGNGQVNWNQTMSSTLMGAATSYAGAGLGQALGPMVSSLTSQIASPVLRHALTNAISTSATGFAIGTGVSLLGGASLGDALRQGGQGALMGFGLGAITGTVSGLKFARDNNLDPWTGKSLQPQQPVQPSDLTNITEKTTIQRNGVEYEIKPRPNPGGDGARSYHVSEVINGDRLSITHIVITPNGVIIHQHQYFIGQSGARYYSPNDLGQFPTINFPKN